MELVEEMNNLSVESCWIASDECRLLNAEVQTLLQNDKLTEERIDQINVHIPEKHKEIFWDRLAVYFDNL